LSVVPSVATACNDNARDRCLNFESITAGSVTAPRSIPDEAPGLEKNIDISILLKKKKEKKKKKRRDPCN
jgi:hypothetical protein